MTTIRQMRYFDALAATLHFGRAAELVHVSQPALSQQIKEMEETLGAKLVERSRGNTLLTRKGEEILAHVRTILSELDRLEHTARRSDGILGGLIRLGIIPTVAPYLVPRLVPHLRKAHPTIEIELREAVTDRLVGDLTEGRLDLVIAALPIDNEAISTRPLFRDRFYMAMAENDSEVLMSPLSESDVDPSRLLLLEEGHCFRDQALSFCRIGSARPREIMEGSSLSTLVQMVSAGIGITLIPEMAVPVETRSAQVSIARFQSPRPSRTIGMIWRNSTPLVRQLMEIAEVIRRSAGSVQRHHFHAEV